MKPIIHKYRVKSSFGGGYGQFVCGSTSFILNSTRKWKEVTCKNCLKFRGKKITDLEFTSDEVLGALLPLINSKVTTKNFTVFGLDITSYGVSLSVRDK